MKLALSKAEKILLLSLCFSALLIITRIWHTHHYTYHFYWWNLFLAIIPIAFSRQLACRKTIDWKSGALIAGWLLFFPNAPYVITDIFHFYQRPDMPLWYDLMLVFSATWNALVAGIISLMQVDKFIAQHTGKKTHAAIISLFMFAASSGIYLGRYLRFNSWDVLTKPRSLAGFAYHYAFQPAEHAKAWAFTCICTVLLLLIYYTIKNLPALVAPAQAD